MNGVWVHGSGQERAPPDPVPCSLYQLMTSFSDTDPWGRPITRLEPFTFGTPPLVIKRPQVLMLHPAWWLVTLRHCFPARCYLSTAGPHDANYCGRETEGSEERALVYNRQLEGGLSCRLSRMSVPLVLRLIFVSVLGVTLLITIDASGYSVPGGKSVYQMMLTDLIFLCIPDR